MSSLRERKSSKTRTARKPARQAAEAGVSLPMVVIGRVTGFGPDGRPLVDYPGCVHQDGVAALNAAAVAAEAVGREVALLFADGDPARPFIVGLLHAPDGAAEVIAEARVEAPEAAIEIDGERLVFTAEREIVLKCGKASLTLTRAGKVLLRGAYVMSRSSGVNRIKGGSVQIN